MKRLLLATMLLFGAVAIHAQEKEKAEEPLPREEMLVWKWANFVILAAGAGYLLGKHLPAFSSHAVPIFRKTLPRLKLPNRRLKNAPRRWMRG